MKILDKEIHISWDIALIFIAIILLRFVFLDSDTVAIQTLHNEDEGNYSYNARNLIVNGELINDQTNFYFISPIFTFLQIPIIKLFGIHVWAFRLINVLTSISTLYLGYWFLKKETNRTIAKYFIMILGLNFLYLIHNRIAIPVTTQGFFFLLSIIFFYYATRVKKINFNRLFYFILAGLFSSLTILTKVDALIILPIILSYFIYKAIKSVIEKDTKEFFARKLLDGYFYLLGLGIPLLMWKGLLIDHNLEKFSIVKRNLIDMHRPYIKTAILNLDYWKKEIPEFLLGGEAHIWEFIPLLIIAFTILAVIIVKNRKKIFNDEFDLITFLFIWTTIGLSYFLAINYKPARFFILNLIPLSIISAYILHTVVNNINLKLFLISIYLTFNLILIYKYIVQNPQYTLRDNSNKLEDLLQNERVIGGNLIYMDNSESKVYNIYFLEKGYSHDMISNYIKDIDYPRFIIIDSKELEVIINSSLNNEYEKVQSNYDFGTIYKRKR